MEDGQGSASGHLEAMMLQEERYWHFHSRRNPYLSSVHGSYITEFARTVSESWRIQICQWYFEVADCFNFDRNVVSVAMNYLDRVITNNLLTNHLTTKEELQLTAVTILYLAMKLHGEIEHPHGKRGAKHGRKKLTIGAFVVLSKHQFDAARIEAMERTLLSILNWQLNPPDARVYVACMLELMPQRDRYLREWRCIFDISRYICELALGQSDVCFQFKPSAVACASILCAINSLRCSARPVPPTRVLQAMSSKIFHATALRLDMEFVTQTAVRLAHLCPSIFVRETARTRPKGSMSQPSSSDARRHESIYIEETANDNKRNEPRKTSPVCVVGTLDDSGFFVKAGQHRAMRY